MQRLIDADAVKENHKRWIGYLDDDMIGRMNFAIDHHVPTVLTIPDNPTNGDMIKALFPNVKILDNGFSIEWRENGKFITTFDGNDWWNAPYKAESEG